MSLLLQCISPVVARSAASNRAEQCPLCPDTSDFDLLRVAFGSGADIGSGSGPIGVAAFDPSATLVVHCGNGFDARFEPYQSTRLSRYNGGP